MNKKFKKSAILLSLGLGIGLAAPNSWATVIGSFTTTGNIDGDNQSATAVFDITSPGNLKLTLTNTSPAINKIKEILDGFWFDITGATLSLTSVTAQNGIIDCSIGSSCTTLFSGPITDNDVSNPTGDQNFSSNPDYFFEWEYAATTGILDTNADLAPNGFKAHGIANATTTVFDGIPNLQHNPYLVGPVDFFFALTGSGTPTISNVAFQWGTSNGDRTSGNPGDNGGGGQGNNAPEPNVIALFGIGLVGMGLSSIRRKRKAH